MGSARFAHPKKVSKLMGAGSRGEELMRRKIANSLLVGAVLAFLGLGSSAAQKQTLDPGPSAIDKPGEPCYRAHPAATGA